MDNAKTCKICGKVKPASDFYAKRSDCKKCSNEKMRLYNQTKSNPMIRNSNRRRVFDTIYEAHCCLVAHIIDIAYQDGCGRVNTIDVKKHGQEGILEITKDGYEFFYDGRARHYLEQIGKCPDWEPNWPGKDASKVRVRVR